MLFRYPKNCEPKDTVHFDGKRYVRTKTSYGKATSYFKADDGTGFLHRAVWEKFCGVSLADDWQVHHIDGNPHNNDPLNLEALPKEAHKKKHRRGEKIGVRFEMNFF